MDKSESNSDITSSSSKSTMPKYCEKPTSKIKLESEEAIVQSSSETNNDFVNSKKYDVKRDSPDSTNDSEVKNNAKKVKFDKDVGP